MLCIKKCDERRDGRTNTPEAICPTNLSKLGHKKWTAASFLRFHFINVGGLGIRFQVMTETYCKESLKEFENRLLERPKNTEKHRKPRETPKNIKQTPKNITQIHTTWVRTWTQYPLAGIIRFVGGKGEARG